MQDVTPRRLRVTDSARPDLFPAIDLRRGQCVRLEQGESDRQTVYEADPLKQASTFASQGARWIHVVDLDAAFGEGSNRELIARIAGEVDVRVQTGGGLRSEAAVSSVLEAGAARAVIGTAAVENPALVDWALETWGADRIVVGLDARGTRPAVRDWREETGEDLFEIGGRLAEAGVETFLYTDISRDGMMDGPNLEMSGRLSRESGADVLVSGGVGRMQHLRNFRRYAERCPGLAGIVVGKAIYEGKVRVDEAVGLLKG